MLLQVGAAALQIAEREGRGADGSGHREKNGGSEGRSGGASAMTRVAQYVSSNTLRRNRAAQRNMIARVRRIVRPLVAAAMWLRRNFDIHSANAELF
jgi:hypothetical protein